MTMHKKTKILLFSIGAVLLVFLIFLYIYRTPKFPEAIPSSEDIEKEAAVIQSQKDLFKRFTRYFRDNHGGLLIAEEQKQTPASGKETTHSQFIHQVKYFDKTLAFNLTKHFCEQEQLEYRIKVIKQDEFLQLPDRYQIEFINKNILWISVLIETAGSGIRQYEESVIETPIELEPDDAEVAAPDDSKSKLAIIIDDLGYSMGVFQKLVNLNYALTFSILPNLEYTQQTAEILRNKQHEILLHLPMQPSDWPKIDPGPGALMIDDDRDTLIRKIEKNLLSVKYATGVNNHMGSAFTKYGHGLNIVMEILKAKNLFFIDSKTVPGNIARNAAYLYKVKYFSRNIFLDNEQDEQKIKRQLYKGVRIAKKHGRAIVIGHPYLLTFKVLANNLPPIQDHGVHIVPVSRLN